MFSDSDNYYRSPYISKNANDLKEARHLLEDRTSAKASQALCCLAKVNGYNILRMALEKGHIDVAMEMLKRGARPNNTTGKMVESPLHCAASQGNADVVQLLLSKGAKLDAINKEGVIALYKAVWANNVEITRLLLNWGGNSKVVDSLFLAVSRGYTEIAQLFLLKGFVNAKDIEGETALFQSVRTKQMEMTRFLLNANANVNAKTISGMTPLHCAAKYFDPDDRTEIVSLLFSYGAEINAKTLRNATALQLAVEKGLSKFAKTLLVLNADINIGEGGSDFLLFTAVEKGDADLTSLLLDKGASVNARSASKQLTRHYRSVTLGHTFVDNVPNIETKVGKGKTALHVAAARGYEGIMKMLMEGGADVNVKDDSGRTPIHNAVERGYEGIMKVLMEGGADVNVKDDSGRTPIHNAVEKGYEGIMKVLMEGGADVNVKDDSGRTPIHKAAERGKVSAVEYLLKQGANVNAKDNEGKTPLFVYAEKGFHSTASEGNWVWDFGNYRYPSHTEYDYNVASVLLTHGAVVGCKDKNGKTGLHVAAERGQASIVKVLLEYGADVNIHADVIPYQTPLHSARGKEVVAILQNHILKLRALNFHIDEMNLDAIDFNSLRVKKFKARCEMEIIRAKKVQIVHGEKKISVHDILSKKKKKNSFYLQMKIPEDESIILGSVPLQFDIFRDMISFNFRFTAERVLLLQEASVLLGELFSIPPGICVEAITDYLGKDDLISFITAARSSAE